MKKILVILFLLSSLSAYAQRLPDAGLSTVRINETNKTIVAEISQIGDNPPVKPGLFYYWYSANAIHATQGGFSGHLLSGRYTEYYLNKNLKEQGFFKQGLKSGIWRTWNEDGTASQVSNWENGILVTNEPVSVWKKVKRSIRKILPHHTDSLKKSN